MKDYKLHVIFSLLQVDVATSPVLADAGDPQKIIARPVSAHLLENIGLKWSNNFNNGLFSDFF